MPALFEDTQSRCLLCPDLQRQVIYVPSYRRCLSPPLGDAKRRKGCWEVVYRKDGSQERHSAASGGAVHFSIIRHADKRAITRPRRPNQSPIIGEIAFNGRVVMGEGGSGEACVVFYTQSPLKW